jgi:hypothetical protein
MVPAWAEDLAGHRETPKTRGTQAWQGPYRGTTSRGTSNQPALLLGPDASEVAGGGVRHGTRRAKFGGQWGFSRGSAGSRLDEVNTLASFFAGVCEVAGRTQDRPRGRDVGSRAPAGRIPDGNS